LNQTATLRISAPVTPLKIKKYGLALRLPAYQTFLPEPYMRETSGRVIAIIDDNEDNRFVFRTYFEDRHRVMEFAEGREALVSMRTDIPDIIFLDISLPGIDGLEVLRQIRQDHQLRHLPVIAVTAHAMIGDRERFLNAGFDGYVSKPIDFTTVTQIIERPSQMYAKGAR
jgi:CheY-like chemotaxis protein